MPAPKPAIPKPAATLPGEADILANVVANLADDHAKLVYADWLEDRDDPRGPLLRKFVQAYRAGKRLPGVSAAPPSWREVVGITLMARLRGSPLASRTDRLLAVVRPALAVVSDAAPEKALAVGASKYGGRPDLPPGTRWPKFEGAPLAFLGQFNLAELHASPAARDLPATGLFSLFSAYNPEEGNDDFPKGSWRLFHFPDATKLARRDFDDDLPDESRFPSCRLWFAEWLTIPDNLSLWDDELIPDDDSEAADAYADLYVDRGLGDHLLGYGFPQQHDLERKTSDRHLLTIGGNDDTEWGWGDGGELYFLLPDAALKQQQFDRVRMEMQGG